MAELLGIPTFSLARRSGLEMVVPVFATWWLENGCVPGGHEIRVSSFPFIDTNGTKGREWAPGS